MIKTDPTLKDSYTEQDIKDMQDALDEKKALRSVGVRGSNLAAAVDAKWTIEGLTREVRTGLDFCSGHFSDRYC